MTSREPSATIPVATAIDTTWPVVKRDVEVGRVEVDVGELDVVQRAGAERTDLLVQAGADPGHLGLADPGVGAHGFDQVVDAARADAVDVGLHHDRAPTMAGPDRCGGGVRG